MCKNKDENKICDYIPNNSTIRCKDVIMCNVNTVYVDKEVLDVKKTEQQ